MPSHVIRSRHRSSQWMNPTTKISTPTDHFGGSNNLCVCGTNGRTNLWANERPTTLSASSLSTADTTLKVNIYAVLEDRTFSMDNVMLCPLVLTICLFMSFVMFLCFLGNPNEDTIRTLSILTLEDMSLQSVRNECLHLDVVGKELEFLADSLPNLQRIGRGYRSITRMNRDRKDIRILQHKLCCHSLSIEHLCCSLWHRFAGTNHSAREPVGTLALYCSIIPVLTAVIYTDTIDVIGFDGMPQFISPLVADNVIWSVVISVVTTLLVMTPISFHKSKGSDDSR